jgi:hypothetical protein
MDDSGRRKIREFCTKIKRLGPLFWCGEQLWRSATDFRTGRFLESIIDPGQYFPLPPALGKGDELQRSYGCHDPDAPRYPNKIIHRNLSGRKNKWQVRRMPR